MNVFNIFGNNRKKMPLEPSYCVYEREGRPLALQGWLFSENAVASIASLLSATGQSWIWESTRTGPPDQTTDEDANPEHRPRQVLAAGLATVLRADLLERNLHGFRRFVALYGGSSRLASIESDDDLRKEVEAFAAGGDSAVSILLVQMGDVAADVIYFNPANSLFIRDLLVGLGAPPLEQVHRAKYRDMQGEELETVMEYLSCAEHDH